MKSDQKHRRRWLTAMLAILFTGLAAIPLVLNIGSREIEFEGAGVIANTLDTHIVTAPAVLEPIARMTLMSGTLKVAARDTQQSAGNRALRLLEGGLADLILRRAELRFGDAQVAAMPAEVGPEAPAMGALQSGRFANLHVEDSTIIVILPHGASERLERVKGSFARVGRKAIRGTGTGVWRGQKVRFSIKSDGQPQAKVAGIPIEIEVAGKLLTLSFAGTLNAEGGLKLDGQGELRTPNLRRLAVALGANWPGGLGGRAFAVRGPLTWAGQVAAFPKATVAIDANEATGAVSINSGRGKVVFAGTLAFDEFDLAAYVGAAAESSVAPDAGTGVMLPAWVNRLSEMWTVPMVHQIDADFRISARKVKWRSAELGPAALAVALKAGKVSVHVAELLFEGGTGAGQISIDFNGYLPQMTLRGRLAHAPIGQLSDVLFGGRYLSGTATVTADLLASGYSMQELLAGLSGTIEADMPTGAMVKLNLHAVEAMPIVAANEGERANLIAAAVRGSTTPIDQLTAAILLNNGTMEVRSATALYDKRARVAKVAGRLELANNAVSFRAMLRPRTPEERAADGPPKNQTVPMPEVDAVSGRLIVGQGGWQAPDVTLSDHNNAPTVLDRMIVTPRQQDVGSRM
jgi:hypothetical protein